LATTALIVTKIGKMHPDNAYSSAAGNTKTKSSTLREKQEDEQAYANPNPGVCRCDPITSDVLKKA
jgi:hypothetical protein